MGWLLLIAFGAYHGLNPGMGWLFALSNGLQQRSARGVFSALLPIAAGHAASVAVVAVAVLLGLRFFSSSEVQVAMGVVLLAFGAYKLKTYYRHPRWVGMKLGAAGLFGWSFVMATAHGAGLMVGPILAGVAREPAHHGAHVHVSSGQGWTAPEMALAVALHTLSMLVVMGAVALVVYRFVGLAILRRAWVNFDLVWAIALVVVGGIAIASVASGPDLHERWRLRASPSHEAQIPAAAPRAWPGGLKEERRRSRPDRFPDTDGAR